MFGGYLATVGNSRRSIDAKATTLVGLTATIMYLT